MGFDIGLWDRLFGERLIIEVPGQGGTRKVSVTKKWLERMQGEGLISEDPAESVTAHVLEPGRGYYTEVWAIGEDIAADRAARFREAGTDAVYVVIAYKDGEKHKMIMTREIWNEAKAKYDELDGDE